MASERLETEAQRRAKRTPRQRYDDAVWAARTRATTGCELSAEAIDDLVFALLCERDVRVEETPA